MTVHDLRTRMSAREWMEWAIYYGRNAQREEMATRTGKGKR